MNIFGYNYDFEYIKEQLPDDLQHLKFDSVFLGKPTFEAYTKQFWEKHYITLLKEQLQKITYKDSINSMNTFFTKILFSEEYIAAINADILIRIISYYKYKKPTEISIKDFMSVSFGIESLAEERTFTTKLTKLINWLQSNYSNYFYGDTPSNLHTYFNLLAWILLPCILYDENTQKYLIKKKKSINNFETYTTSILLDIMFKYQSTTNIGKYPKFDLKLIIEYVTRNTPNILANFQYLSIIDKANFTYTMECCTLNSYFSELITIFINQKLDFFPLYSYYKDRDKVKKIINLSPVVPINTGGHTNNLLKNNPEIIPLNYFTDCIFIDGLQQRKIFQSAMNIESISKYNYYRKDFLKLSTYLHQELYPYISNLYFCYLKNSMGDQELNKSIISYITNNPNMFSEYLDNSPYAVNKSDKIKISNFDEKIPDKKERLYLSDTIRNTFDLYTKPHITDNLIYQTVLNGSNIIPPILFINK